jgi:hypothetical protein
VKAATAQSKILSTRRDSASTRPANFISRLRECIRCYTRVLIAELLCATSSEKIA